MSDQIYELREYQEKAVVATTDGKPEINRRLIVAATGAGKTIIMAEIVKRKIAPGRRALVIAHREELISQAADKISRHVPNVFLQIEKAERRAYRSIYEGESQREILDRQNRPTVVVASVQSLKGARLQSFPPDFFDLIMIDEAHHVWAESYRNVIRHFGCGNPRVRTPLIGVTATPDRDDGKELGKIFQTEAFRVTLEELILEGYLVRVKGIVATSQVNLSGVAISGRDYEASELGEAVNTAERNALVVQAWTERARDRKTIIFGASVAHAKRLAELLREVGFAAESVDGKTPRDERRAIFARFASGETQILTNCAVTIEGFDEPSVSCIVLARPTRSRTMVSQCVGRGTRLYENKTDVLVIDVRDLGDEKTATLNDLFGIPKKFDPDGADLLEIGMQVRDIDPALRDRILDAASLKTVHDLVRAGMTIKDFDVLDRTRHEAAMAEITTLTWRNAGDGYTLDYVATAPDGTRLPRRNYRVEPDTLGAWRLTVSDGEPGKLGYRSEMLPGSAGSARDAFARWDTAIAKRHHFARLLDANANWAKEPASEKQLFNLWGMGLFKAEADVPKDLNKRQASEMIEKCNDNGLKFSYRRVPESLRHVRPPKERPAEFWRARAKTRKSTPV